MNKMGQTLKHLTPSLICLALSSLSFAADPQSIPLDQLGEKFQLIGKLHVPLGQVVTLEGVVVEGPFIGYEGGFNLRVQKIQGTETQEDIQIVIRPFFRDWGEEVAGETSLPLLKIGATYEVEGYSTGGYIGVPSEVFERGAVTFQTPDHYFLERFAVTKAKQTQPVSFSPSMFAGKRALIRGKAVTQGGKALMTGEDWTVIVQKSQPWPEHVEGKTIETYGMYNPDFVRREFALIDGTWHLVRLEDQLGQNVELRGKARSSNGVWWFNYRGVDVYVEDMEKLPGWTRDNHWKPMVIRGVLEKASLPRLDQISRKPDRDLKEYFIVKKASWEPLPALLSPERPFTEPR